MTKTSEQVGHKDLVGGQATSLHLHSGLIPTGFIGMWSVLLSNIPSGWALCDGSNGTPNLRDRFILSVGTGENPGATGGSSSLAHSGTAVDSHTGLSTNAADAGATQRWTTSSTLTLKAHVHSLPTMTHSVTQPSVHTDTRPPYFKLAFIMKL